MHAENRFLIAGIGASAGGLEAFERLFRPMPADTGIAFLLMTHLARGVETSLPEIVGRFTAMPVSVASENLEIASGHVYICPPDHVMTVARGRVHLHPLGDEGNLRPIDVFLASLAQERGDSAIGILLSGGGSDGTLGLKAIKERGGLTLAQGGNGSAPTQRAMPDAAISAGVVDLVLPAEEMSARLAAFARRDARVEADEAAEQADGDEENRGVICRLLLDHVGHDFSGYKESTFGRRVRRRMHLLEIEHIGDYVERLRSNPDELHQLFRDLLVGATTFFRDPAAFAALDRRVIPQLFEGKGASDAVRIWVPGCSTGEEVYSLAMLLLEHQEGLRAAPAIQVFATDIDERALAVARSGRYPASLLESISSERIKRFFSVDDGTCTVNRAVRELCVFSAHSVIRDPPFSRIDLISCRNLLMYFGADFQALVLPAFHYALQPGGYLFLGSSEAVAHSDDLFAPLDKKHRLYRRRDDARIPLVFPQFAGHERPSRPRSEFQREHDRMAGLRRTVEARVLDRFTPAHVVTNRDGEVVYYSSRTGKYLEAPPGPPNRQLVGLVRPGLRLDLKAALTEAVGTGGFAIRRRVEVEIEDRVQLIDLMVEPLHGEGADPLFLVLFSDLGPPISASVLRRHDIGDANAGRLERELRDTRERLQAIIEEYETGVEELSSANEELQSMNEEMQSANEELETSKEELQSVNEELRASNAELGGKIEEVDRANSDLRNVLDSTQIAVVFLDRNLGIRSFTPALTGIFNLIAADRGRRLTDFVSHLAEDVDIKSDIGKVMARGESAERRVRHADGTIHYVMRILPYRTPRGVIDGALVTFVDVTQLVESDAHQRVLVQELNHRVRNMLAVVGAVASQTLAKSASPQDFERAFLGRIEAMAKSYGLVSKEEWGEVQFEALLGAELRAYAQESPDRVSLEGPALAFKPQQALALGLVVHELATNAAKYGALSSTQGRIAVTWSAGPREIAIRWREIGGPKIGAPERRGFGTQLVERQVRSALGGAVSFDFAPAGLTVEISIPSGNGHPSTQGGGGRLGMGGS